MRQAKSRDGRWAWKRAEGHLLYRKRLKWTNRRPDKDGPGSTWTIVKALKLKACVFNHIY